MPSTRTRLTASYTVVLLGTMAAFALAVWWLRRAAAYDRLGQEVAVMGDNVLTQIRAAQLSGKRLTYRDSAPLPLVRATQELGELLDRMPGYFLVLDSQDKLLYSSTLVRLLSADDQQDLFELSLSLSGGEAEIVRLRDTLVGRSGLYLVARNDISVGPNISRVVSGLPTETAELAARLLLGTLLALMPIMLLISLGFAYWIAGSSFRPVHDIINEVEAITDGRSLHRRLPVDQSNDELSRLAATLNAMIARLETSFAGLRRFTADASHELRTPLTVLRADVERAMHPGTRESDRMVALEEALQETARMADLVDSLLTLARADEGRFDLHRAPIRLEPLVREVFETAVILGEEADLTVELPALEDAVVLGDRNRLRHLFLNLITNAIKYTPHGGRVEISLTRRAHDEVAFAVRDTGIGIAASDLTHVFERFWRADRARSRRVSAASVDVRSGGGGGGDGAAGGGGFGLGLSIAQWIVQAHGGSLAVQSRLGRGSIFTVTLAVAPPTPVDDDTAVEAGEPVGKADANSEFTNS